MNFTIRQAEQHDAVEIARVQVESWKATYAGIVPDAFLASLNIEAQSQMWSTQFAEEHPLIFVTEDEAGVFGFVAGGKIREALANYDAELYAIYLLPQYQKHGAGRQLCHRLAASLRTIGFLSMAVWVLEDNPSVAFYKRIGGIPVTQRFIDVGGVALPELAFGWPSWDQLPSGNSD
jgi:GNAT superfamily N-acetyltransferase